MASALVQHSFSKYLNSLIRGLRFFLTLLIGVRQHNFTVSSLKLNIGIFLITAHFLMPRPIYVAHTKSFCNTSRGTQAL